MSYIYIVHYITGVCGMEFYHLKYFTVYVFIFNKNIFIISSAVPLCKVFVSISIYNLMLSVDTLYSIIRVISLPVILTQLFGYPNVICPLLLMFSQTIHLNK